MEQCITFDEVYTLASATDGKGYFLHGPGGAGKMFVYSTLCSSHLQKRMDCVVLCTMSSGIAALLLPGGHTAHSPFVIPVETLAEDSYCHIDKNSKHMEMLRIVRLIIWDEALTQHRYYSLF